MGWILFLSQLVPFCVSHVVILIFELPVLSPECLLTVLTNEDVSTSGEALLYCVGALKFLSGNGSTVKLLLDNSCIAVGQNLIQRLCSAEKDSFTMAGHILVQVCCHFSKKGAKLWLDAV